MKKVLSIIVIPVFVVFMFSSTGCFKDPEAPACNYDSCGFKAPAAEILAVQHYLDSIGVTATQHCSGLFYTIDSAGSGVSPKPCQGIAVRYKGMLTNGHVFDSSVTDVPLLLNGVIEGWQHGLQQSKEGGTMTLYIPPSLGYGTRVQYDRNNPNVVLIPANSILVFKVRLVKVYE